MVERVLVPTNGTRKARGVKKGKVDKEYMRRMCPDFEEMEGQKPEYKERCATDASITTAFPLPPVRHPVHVVEAAATGVDSVAWMGNDLVTASHDGAVKIWEVDPLAQKHRVRVHIPRASGAKRGHRGGVYTCCVSTDQQTLVTGGRGSQSLTGFEPGDLLVWRNDCKDVSVCRGHNSAVYSANFAPNSQRVVSSNRGGDVLIHDLSRPDRPIFSKHVHQGVASHASFCLTSPDRYLSAGVDGCLRTGDLRVPVQPIEAFWRTPSTFANYVYVRSMDGIEQAHSGEAVNSAVWLDDHTIISAGSDFKLKKWDLRKGNGADAGKCVLEYLGHLAPVRFVAVDDAKRVFSACADGSVRVWPLHKTSTGDICKAQVAAELRAVEVAIQGARTSKDADALRDALSQQSALRVREVEAGQAGARSKREVHQSAQMVLGGHKGVASGVAVRGEILASSSWDQTVRFFEL